MTQLNKRKLQEKSSRTRELKRGKIENAGHTTIHTDRPDGVVRAIRDLVDSIRDVTTIP